MHVRLHAAESNSIPRKNISCTFNAVFSYVQSNYRMLGFTSIGRFQKGCH
jgi:hypothetical protein